MFSEKIAYEPLRQSHEKERLCSEEDLRTAVELKLESAKAKASLRRTILLWLSATANLVFLTVAIYLYGQRGPYNPIFPQALFSPAQDAIKYTIEKFDVHDNIYKGGPTPATNAAWSALYAGGTTSFPAEQAHLLPNQTIAANPDGSGGYLVVLSVVHDLHCIDKLRLGLWYFYDTKWNETYNPYTIPVDEDHDRFGVFGIEHLDHCLDFLRQSIQCSGDVTPYVYQWAPQHQEIRSFADIVHTCRDWDSIHEWTTENHFDGHFDISVPREERGQCRFAEDGSCLKV